MSDWSHERADMREFRRTSPPRSPAIYQGITMKPIQSESPVAPTEHIIQFFAHAHLPPHLAAVSRPFGELANQIVATLPRNPERTVALRKLLEAKDAAVRALLAK